MLKSSDGKAKDDSACHTGRYHEESAGVGKVGMYEEYNGTSQVFTITAPAAVTRHH